MFLSVQPPRSKHWVMRVRKHPSTLLQDCMSPLNVCQRQLWLRVLQGWMGMCCRGTALRTGEVLFFLSLPCAAGVEAFVLLRLVLPSSLWAVGYHVAEHPQLLAVFLFFYVCETEGFVYSNPYKFLCHVPSFQYSGCCPEGHGFPGLLARG